jgi:hypothetical protein
MLVHTSSRLMVNPKFLLKYHSIPPRPAHVCGIDLWFISTSELRSNPSRRCQAKMLPSINPNLEAVNKLHATPPPSSGQQQFTTPLDPVTSQLSPSTTSSRSIGQRRVQPSRRQRRRSRHVARGTAPSPTQPSLQRGASPLTLPSTPRPEKKCRRPSICQAENPERRRP